MTYLGFLLTFLVFAGQAHAGDVSSGGEPLTPFVPSVPFRYSCELSLNVVHYTNDPYATVEWESKAQVILDNNKLGYSGIEVSWKHFKRNRPPTVYIPPFQLSQVPPPHSLEVAAGLEFTKRKGKAPIPTSLFLTLPFEQAMERNTQALSFIKTTFNEPQIHGVTRLSYFDKQNQKGTIQVFEVKCSK